MNSPIKNRLLQFLEHLGIGQGAFEKNVGISNGYVNNINKSIGSKILLKISQRYPELNSDWLLSGEGVMLKKKEDEAVPILNPNIKMIPLVSQYAQAGYLCGFSDEEYMETLPKVPIIVDHEIKGEYVAFEVKGDSMDNETAESLLEGEILIGRKIQRYIYVIFLSYWDKHCRSM